MNAHMSGKHEALAFMQAAWNLAGENWDTEAMTSIYAQDALLFGGRTGHWVGTSAIRKYFDSYVGIIESCSLELVDQHLIEIRSGCLLAQGYGVLVFRLRGDMTTRSRLRTTLFLEREGAIWKIRQHHFSASPDAPALGQLE